MSELFFTAFATLFIIVDPIGISAIAISLTDGKTFEERRRIAFRACLIAFFVLLVFGYFGEALLSQIGIGMAAFRVSGGILLFITALEILFGHRGERRSQMEGGHDPTVFPLAMPLLAGPGAMTAMILLFGEHQGEWIAQANIIGTLLLVLLITFFLTLLFIRMSHLLGETGLQLINRFLAIILAALSVQFIADGILEYVQGVS